MFFEFKKAAEDVASNPVLDNEKAREKAKFLPLDAFVEAVQTLRGNTAEKCALVERKKSGADLTKKEWARLKVLKGAPMDADLFRKVCRTALESDLIPKKEKKLLSAFLPNKASKIGNNWPLPSPANCKLILDIFSTIKPASEQKPEFAGPAWMNDDFKPTQPLRKHGRPFGL